MADSEKDDKQRDAQARRTAVHVRERQAVFADIEFPPEKRHDGAWVFAKDGKARIDPVAPWGPKAMRK